MVSGFSKINQTQCTFLQYKYLIEVGLWTVARMRTYHNLHKVHDINSKKMPWNVMPLFSDSSNRSTNFVREKVIMMLP